MSRLSAVFAPLGFCAAMGSHAVLAQEPPGNEAAVRARVGAELACVEGSKNDLAQWVRLLTDARTQLEHGSSVQIRADAARSIIVLEGHLRETAADILACIEESTPVSEPLATQATRAPAPPVALSTYVRATLPVSSGPGRADPTAVHRALVPYAREVDVCYEALADRHAIVRGNAELVLQLRADGSISRSELRGLAIGDATFARCVEQARSRVASAGRPTGGATTLSVTLHFGPEGESSAPE